MYVECPHMRREVIIPKLLTNFAEFLKHCYHTRP